LINMVMVREGLARVGMILLPEARNKGTGTAALSLFVDNIMDSYPVARIEADTDCSNLAAQHMLENAGFLCEGTLRAFRFHHGFYHDSLLYSFIRE
ncbi:MAG: GNAT family N-acetyltransferase, partial [Clostridia bacterium]|nr:GNAT family N-acetyltransferase [Clostridia bacterium]